jgi:hypothetical protein
VTVYPGFLPLRIESADWYAGSPPSFRLTFTAVAGMSYTVQYRDSLAAGGWSKWGDVAVETTQTVRIWDNTVASSPHRYYRIVTPAQP